MNEVGVDARLRLYENILEGFNAYMKGRTGKRG